MLQEKAEQIPSPILNVQGLSCERNDRLLFQHLDFELRPHQVLLVEGRNGSGKTSLLKILCGIRLADDGEVSWCGESIQRLGGEYTHQLAYVGHTDGIKLELSVAENLNMARAMGRPANVSIDTVLEQLKLSAHHDDMCRMLSAGQRRRVALGRLLITQAPLWILDEPFTSLDTQGVAFCEALIEQHITSGGMVVMTSHHAVNLDNQYVQRINLST